MGPGPSRTRHGVAPRRARPASTDSGVQTTVDHSTLEDREVAALACKGRESAFRELLARYERPVFSLVYRMVRDRTLAEDLAQEAFIKAFHALGSYKPEYKFSSWLFKIANNLTIDHLRKKKLDTISIDGSPHASGEEETSRTRFILPDTGETPDEYTENRELGGQIEDAIARLRPEYRTAILLRHVEGHSYDEVADIMELPLGTVKTYIHRGRSELKELLSEVAA
ncbi:MAG: sigma-70 family RNA polymerase sigma factor [Gemmatimonadales bacterium]|nr:MAG: sigma-70 family RNA polymerase sigma factor [Gemmatimonadales bacterium]